MTLAVCFISLHVLSLWLYTHRQAEIGFVMMGRRCAMSKIKIIHNFPQMNVKLHPVLKMEGVESSDICVKRE